MNKVITWVLANGATLLGCLQAIIKALKELATGLINLISIFTPKEGTVKAIEAVRGVFNGIDDIVEKIKQYLLK